MFCKNCGTQINDDAKFCTNCGANIVIGNNTNMLNNEQIQNNNAYNDSQYSNQNYLNFNVKNFGAGPDNLNLLKFKYETQ